MTRKMLHRCMKCINKKYGLMCLCMGMTEFLSVYIVWGVGDFINKISRVGNGRDEIQEMLILLFMACGSFGLKYIAQHLNFQNSNVLMIYMQGEVLDHLMYADYAMLAQRDHIGMTQQINNDCVTVSDYYIEKLPKLVFGCIKIVALFVIIAFCSWEVSLVLLAFILIYYVIYLCEKKTYKMRNQKMLLAMSDFFALLGGQILNIFLIKVNSWHNKSKERFSNAGKEFIGTSVKFLDLDYWLNNFLNTTSIITLVLIPFFLSGREAGAGMFIIVITYVQMLIPYIQEFMDTIKFSVQNKNAQERLNQLLTIGVEQIGEKRIGEISEIQIEDISFHYCKSEKHILKNFSFTLEKGKIYLVKGENGTGKSTLLNLLLGIYRPDTGAIYYNREDMTELDVLNLREKCISFCEQEPYLIKGTIRENLNDEEIDTRLLDFVENLENGYETIVDSKASRLSGGQKQRIALARALGKQAELYILDEPTNALDAQAIEILKEELQCRRDNAIILVVSHDPKMTDLADKVITF